MSADFDDTDERRRRIMRSIGSENTEPERVAREALEELGVGYEEQPRYGRYRPDFRLEDGTVLQLHGCFWHACPCVSRGMDQVDSHEEYWTEKQRKNVERDRRRRRELLEEHDVPLVFWIWEHEDVAERVLSLCRYLGLVRDAQGGELDSNE